MNIKKRVLLQVCDAIVDVVRAGGGAGVPGGTLYAALMAHGCTLDQFEGIMRALVATSKVEKRGQLYFAAKPFHTHNWKSAGGYGLIDRCSICGEERA